MSWPQSRWNQTDINCDAKTKEKGKGKQNAGKPGAKGDHCAICGPEKEKIDATEECYFNARANPVKGIREDPIREDPTKRASMH